MSAASSIEWTDRTWNPTRGCRRVSPGCENCYAERQAARFAGAGAPYEGLVQLGKNGPRWTGVGRLIPSVLAQPLSWRKPAKVFVDSMSDLFFEEFTNEEISAVFGVMAACPQHTFQILTKRADRLPKWFAWVSETGYPQHFIRQHAFEALTEPAKSRFSELSHRQPGWGAGGDAWPLPNVWLGVSVENQEYADARIPALLGVPAAIRFVSYEPALGPVDFENIHVDDHTVINALAGIYGEGGRADCRGLDWVIPGGESGPGARPFAEEWGARVILQCHRADVAVFLKQVGAHPVSEHRTAPYDPLIFSGAESDYADYRAPNGEIWAWRAGLKDSKGGDPSEWPEHLRVREYPRLRTN